MRDVANDIAAKAKAHAWSMPIEDINVADPELFRNNSFWPYFERLRAEAPVHYTPDSEYGPYWSITRYNDIISVDTNHQVYSSLSTLGGIAIRDQSADFPLPMFIAMDRPDHTGQRRTVAPAFTPAEIERIDAKLGRFSGRITRDQWVEQAKLLAAGDESSFVSKFGQNG